LPRTELKKCWLLQAGFANEYSDPTTTSKLLCGTGLIQQYEYLPCKMKPQLHWTPSRFEEDTLTFQGACFKAFDMNLAVNRASKFIQIQSVLGVTRILHGREWQRYS
jgi:hypothetical protein